jgi:hypothetical protein
MHACNVLYIRQIVQGEQQMGSVSIRYAGWFRRFAWSYHNHAMSRQERIEEREAEELVVPLRE